MPENRGNKKPLARNPWEELAEQAYRSSNQQRSNTAERDRVVLSAIRAGSSPRELAELLGVSVQAIYQATERAEAELGVDGSPLYSQVLTRLGAMTDPVAFEQLATQLFAKFLPDLRPTQRSGDLGRDAVAGSYQGPTGEEIVVTISLAKDWSRKVREDMSRLADQGLRPDRVYAVTNRLIDERRLRALRKKGEHGGWLLTVFDARWLATQLVQPEYAELRRQHLGLAEPKPKLFLDRDDYVRLLNRANARPQVPFIGRERELESMMEFLSEQQTVILEAPGGQGKSRLLAEAAERKAPWEWVFVREGLPFSSERVGEIPAGEVAVVIDDAHRREDRRSLFAALEQRQPPPRLVLVSRPGFGQAIEADLAGLALGPAKTLQLHPMPRAELAKLLEEPPLEIRFRGLRTAIVELAEGNPQIALISGELSQQGLSIHELRSNELMRTYTGAVLRDAGEGRRERIALMALVAAAGPLALEGEEGTAASELLGISIPHLRREVADLADRGLLREQEGLVSIKPDLLAEWILLGCFFDRSWDAALDYTEVFRRFEKWRRQEMLTTLGQAFRSAPESLRDSPHLIGIRREILTASEGTWSTTEVAAALGAVAPGLPNLALEGFDRLIAELDADPRSELWPVLLQVPTRVPIFQECWPRMLALAQRLFAAHGFDDPLIDSRQEGENSWSNALKAVSEAFQGVHSRLPIDQSPYDGRILADVQMLMAQLTRSWWINERSDPGAAATALLAARTMLTVTFESHLPDAADRMRINMISVGVPPTEQTERCLTAGVDLLLEALPDLSLRGQMRAVEVLRALAHPALGFAGPFGIELSEETRKTINDLFDGKIVPWFAQHLADLPLPAAAATVEMTEWRTHFREESISLEATEHLRDYRELIDPGEEWSLDESIEGRRNRLRGIAARYAKQLIADPEPKRQLERWRGWYELRLTADRGESMRETLGMLFEKAAELDPQLGAQIVDFLLQTDSPLLSFVSPAMRVVLQHDPSRGESWLRFAPENGRLPLAWAAAELDNEATRRQLLEALSHDSSSAVRQATGRALRYRTGLSSGWQLELALELSLESDGAWLLTELLEELAEEEPAVHLTAAQRQQVERALLQTADEPSRADDHLVTEGLRNARKLGQDLTWPWFWRRLERVEAASWERNVLQDIVPGEVVELLSEGEAGAKSERLEEVLKALERSNLPWRVEEKLLELALALDDGTLKDRLNEWSRQEAPRHRRTYQILRAPMSWERFETYAAAVLAADPSQETIKMVVHAREPTSFMGSRVPHYEGAQERFERWMSNSNGDLVRVALCAKEYYDNRIAEAHKEERARLESYD